MSSSELSATELKELGNKAFGGAKYTEAIEFYTKAIELDSKNAVLYSNRAMSYLKIKEWNKALQDCDTGLQVVDEDKLKTKLLFRKASCFRGMGSNKLARNYFEKVVERDSQNQAAIQELDLLKDDDDMEGVEEHKNETSINIPIDRVDELPEQFQTLINNAVDPQPKEPLSNEHLHNEPLPENRESVDKEINELFGNKTKKPIEPQTNKNDGFVKRSATSMLSALKSIPGANKVNAYNYLINIPPAELADDFSFGIEHEFLNFYLESAAYASSNNSVTDWDQKVLKTLTTLSTIKRYSISLTFCDDIYINKILENVAKTNPPLLQQYKALLLES